MKYLFQIALYNGLAWSICLNAQPITSNTYEAMLETADQALVDYNYFNAIEWYEKAYQEQRDPNTALAIADLYNIVRDYRRAESWYNRILRRDRDNQWLEVRYDYGKVLKAQGKYKEAIEEFNLLISLTDDEELKSEAQLELEGILMIEEYPDNIDVVITYAGNDINSASGEYSPSLYSDGTLYFGSFNTRREIVLDGTEDDYHAKIFRSMKDVQGNYGKPQELGQNINRKGFHNANVCFTPDGKVMFFTRIKLAGNEIEESKIYRAYWRDNDWGAAEIVPSVNGPWNAKQPVVGELFGNQVLFFVSDMDGGYGGDDIYYSTIRGDDFSSPVNLGPVINTHRDEVTPFYKEGILYFSSTGFPGLGGFDIFSSAWDGSTWSTPKNLGHNYNTSLDDLYFRMNESGTLGFLISNRPDKDKRNLKGPTCCDDIYFITIRDLVIDLLAFVEDDKGPLNEATMEILDLSVEGGVPDAKSNSTGNKFNFLLESDHNYIVITTRDGYFPDTFSFNTVGILDDYTVKKTVKLKSKPVEEEETELAYINQPIRLSNIYYEYDDDKIIPESEPSLEYLASLMKEHPDMIIELSSHTDSRGLSNYNQQLSQRRAESARVWLLDAGIEEGRIKAVGYGESRIINRCVDGVRCSEEEHRYNRRTEFKILEGPQTIKIKKSLTGDRSNEPPPSGSGK